MTITPTRFGAGHPGGALELPGEEPQVWVVGAGEYAAVRGAGVLDEGERRRAAAFVRDEDRELYTVAHVALRVLLGRYLDADPAGLSLVRLPCPGCGGPHGRPAVEGEPVRFSLSHSAEVAVLAFAAVPVGVDVERVPRARAVDEISPLFHPRETAELAALDEGDRAEAFARIWARKEAYFKGLGLGLARGLERDYIGSATSARSPAGWRISDVEVAGTHRAAVATAVPGTP